VAQTLLDAGWSDVRALLGGLEPWVKAGYPVEPKSPERPPAHQLSMEEAERNLRNAEGRSS